MDQTVSQPYYGGLVSFFRTPSIGIEEATEGLAVVADVPIDNGIPTGRVGTRFGPGAIRRSPSPARPRTCSVLTGRCSTWPPGRGCASKTERRSPMRGTSASIPPIS